MQIRTLALAAAALTLAAAPAAAQTGRVEIRPVVGAYVPAGAQADQLEPSVAVGGQLSYGWLRNLAVVGTVWYAPTERDGDGEDGVDVLSYDLGVELFADRPVLGPLRPFVGGGVGGRSFSFEDDAVDGETNLAGYVSAGTNVDLAPRVSLRAEGRGYLSDSKGLTGDDGESRGDFLFTLGLGYRF